MKRLRRIMATVLVLSTLQFVGQAQNDVHSAKKNSSYLPSLHGILRGKYEFEPDLSAGRFEVRNARLSVEGNLPERSAYKMEVDLCDESAIKMKDAWVRVMPMNNLRITIGQQRMPFSIDAHRNPSAQYFANRSFIAKQVGDMRDVGAALGIDVNGRNNRRWMSFDAGIYNGSSLDNQKTAWFQTPAYSARIQFFPVEGLLLTPSIQHQLISDRNASYTSYDLGASYEVSGMHVEAEFLHKTYANNAFTPCNALNVMSIYRQKINRENSFFQSISYLLRYDRMDDHSDGKKGFDNDKGKLILSDLGRQRITAGMTFSVSNKDFPTDIRFNYEKYFYSSDSKPKEGELDKLVLEVMVRF